jgi:hypothetical protein
MSNFTFTLYENQIVVFSARAWSSFMFGSESRLQTLLPTELTCLDTALAFHYQVMPVSGALRSAACYNKLVPMWPD